ncbi:MAG: Serine/threonine protein phosphatase 1 [uncultured Aureispira sp.]|uniref:Serine/threonine protein phosphatase 1 n=1 Tax=uncultured Aureispira sp. TaxID=1331704 RepID=A0A6S6SV00_9BACT|nr:MAG: Serine/threonine protein phosphatase 1 [uncultured Aureispira sp.]
MGIHLPTLPKGRQLVIGAVHGCFDTLYALIEEQIQLQQGDQLIFLGDLINRGTDSKKVLDYLMQLGLEYEVHCIKGNHEHNFLTAYDCGMDFFDEFLHEYNSDDLMAGDLPMYLNFCAQMPYYIETATHLFSHMGFSASQPRPMTDTRAYFHNQALSISEASIQNKIQIQGHVAMALSKISQAVEARPSVLNIDAGCYYNTVDGLGYLCALDTKDNLLYVQKNIEKAPNLAYHQSDLPSNL